MHDVEFWVLGFLFLFFMLTVPPLFLWVPFSCLCWCLCFVFPLFLSPCLVFVFISRRFFRFTLLLGRLVFYIQFYFLFFPLIVFTCCWLVHLSPLPSCVPSCNQFPVYVYSDLSVCHGVCFLTFLCSHGVTCFFIFLVFLFGLFCILYNFSAAK